MAKDFRDVAREVAKKNNVAFWPLTDAIGPKSERWTREGFFKDGLHYNDLGGSVFARLLLRQIGFDIQDPVHYRVLYPEQEDTVTRPKTNVALFPQTPKLDDVDDRLRDQAPMTIWRQDVKAAEIRLGIGKDGNKRTILLHARVFDGRIQAGGENTEQSNIDVYFAKPDSDTVRQIVFRCGGKAPDNEMNTLHESGKQLPLNNIESITSPGKGEYDVCAIIPFSVLGLSDDAEAFLFESAAVTAPAPGAPASFDRLAATSPDGGAFRDSSQSILCTINR